MPESSATNSASGLVKLKIRFKCTSLEQFILRFGMDLSQNGIFVRTREPLAVHTRVAFELQLQDGAPLLSGDGTVVWRLGAAQGSPSGMGVRFDSLTADSEQRLQAILAGQAEQAPHGVVSRFDRALSRECGPKEPAVHAEAMELAEKRRYGMDPHVLRVLSEGIHDSSLQPMADRGAQSAGMRSPLLGQGFGLEPMGVRGPIAGSESALEAQRLADALAKGKQDGWLGVDAPQDLPLHATARVRAVAIRDALERVLVDQALTQNAQQILPTRLAPRVCMMLSPVEFRDFTVRPLTPEEQPVLADELTVWEWLITANEPGEKLLLLSVTNMIEQPGSTLCRALPARSLKVHVTVTPQAVVPALGTAALRRLLDSLVQSDADLDALCIDHFPTTRLQFGSGMERRQKVNLLLCRERAGDILRALRGLYPESFEDKLAACRCGDSGHGAAQPDCVSIRYTG